MDFATPADHRVEIKQNVNSEKYLDLARELNILWNMKVTVLPIVRCALVMMLKGLVRVLEGLEIGGRTDTIKITQFCDLPEYQEES